MTFASPDKTWSNSLTCSSSVACLPTEGEIHLTAMSRAEPFGLRPLVARPSDRHASPTARPSLSPWELISPLDWSLRLPGPPAG